MRNQLSETSPQESGFAWAAGFLGAKGSVEILDGRQYTLVLLQNVWGNSASLEMCLAMSSATGLIISLI